MRRYERIACLVPLLFVVGCTPQVIYVQTPATFPSPAAARISAEPQELPTTTSWSADDLKAAADVCSGKTAIIETLVEMRDAGMSEKETANETGRWLASALVEHGIDINSEQADVLISFASVMVTTVYQKPHGTADEEVAVWEQRCFQLMASDE